MKLKKINMLEAPLVASQNLAPRNIGNGQALGNALELGWTSFDIDRQDVAGALDVRVLTSSTGEVDDQTIELEAKRAVEAELFEWSLRNEDLATLFKTRAPGQWFTLRSSESVTQILNFSARELTEADIEELRISHERTNQLTGGASAQATKAIVITDQDFLGTNKAESRPSNGKSHSFSGVVFLSERIFDPENKSTKDYVKQSGATQAMAVTAHEEMHQAQLGHYSPVKRSGYDHLAVFKSRHDWQERSYEASDGSQFTIVGIGNAALEGTGVELPVSAYGYFNAKEDTAEAGAALVIGVDPGSTRTASIEDLSRVAREYNPKLGSQQFEAVERPTDIPLGESELDYPTDPIKLHIYFEMFHDEGD